MGVANASDHAAKVLWGDNHYRGMEGWSFTGEPFGDGGPGRDVRMEGIAFGGVIC
jgi:hypothetical protein